MGVNCPPQAPISTLCLQQVALLGGVPEMLGDAALLEGVCHWVTLKVCNLYPLPSLSVPSTLHYRPSLVVFRLDMTFY